MQCCVVVFLMMCAKTSLPVWIYQFHFDVQNAAMSFVVKCAVVSQNAALWRATRISIVFSVADNIANSDLLCLSHQVYNSLCFPNTSWIILVWSPHILPLHFHNYVNKPNIARSRKVMVKNFIRIKKFLSKPSEQDDIFLHFSLCIDSLYQLVPGALDSRNFLEGNVYHR